MSLEADKVSTRNDLCYPYFTLRNHHHPLSVLGLSAPQIWRVIRHYLVGRGLLVLLQDMRCCEGADSEYIQVICI